MEPNFDLFGNPVRAGHGERGRPSYEASVQDRNKVKLLLALGWVNQRIANALGISLPTLKRYFRAELKIRDAMRDRLDARRFEIAMEQANAGNMTALKVLGDLIDRSDRMAFEHAMGESDRKAEKPTGKKIVDEQRAKTADADLMSELEAEAENARLHS